MQFNILAALLFVVAATAVFEANALPIANIMPVHPLSVNMKAWVHSAGAPISNKQMAKGLGW